MRGPLLRALFCIHPRTYALHTPSSWRIDGSSERDWEASARDLGRAVPKLKDGGPPEK